MTLNITQTEIDTLWAQGYRPFEIYTKNPEPIFYGGRDCEAGEIDGWDIKFVFAKRESLENYPLFDAVIGVDSIASCEEVFHG